MNVIKDIIFMNNKVTLHIIVINHIIFILINEIIKILLMSYYYLLLFIL
jgi:hypothetical protein